MFSFLLLNYRLPGSLLCPVVWSSCLKHDPRHKPPSIFRKRSWLRLRAKRVPRTVKYNLKTCRLYRLLRVRTQSFCLSVPENVWVSVPLCKRNLVTNNPQAFFFIFWFFRIWFVYDFRACPETYSVGQAGIELTEILLSLPPECWD